MQQFSGIKNSFFFYFLLIAVTLTANEKNDTLYVRKYLQLGPVESAATFTIKENKCENALKEILSSEQMDFESLYPKAGETFQLTPIKSLTWLEKETSGDELVLESSGSNSPQMYYEVFYLQAERYLSAGLKIKSPQMCEVFLDGKKITKKESYEIADSTGEIFPGVIAANVKLETGKHIVLVKFLASSEMHEKWYLETWLEVDKKFANSLSVTTDPVCYANFKELLDNVKITDISISPDGNIAALKFSQRDIEEDKDESWIQFYDTYDGTLINIFRGGISIGEVDWAPRGVMFAYQTSGNAGGSIWIYDFSSGENYELLKNEKDLSGFRWNNDALSIFFTKTKTPEPSDKNFKRHEKIEDRWPYGNDITTLHQVFLPNGLKRELTGNDFSASIGDVNKSGESLIFSRVKYDATKWPFSTTTFYNMNLNTLKTDSLFEMIFAGEVRFSPDGKKLLVIGGPSSFNGVGKNLPKNIWPNDYDNQAFIYDLESKSIDPITKNFNPSIDEIHWTDNNLIYFVTTDKSFRHLYRYDILSRMFTLVNLDDEYLTKIDISEEGSKAVYISESSNKPRRIFTLDLASEKFSKLLDPDFDSFRNIKLGEVKDYTFKSQKGKEILGRVYYPPNFDPQKKYPLVVHYYGGTSPIDRNFEGRYPQNIWAANGYIVCTLQPSGSVGFGQEFSAAHVNDWGKTTAEEIIQGATRFIKEHKFIDGNRVGCIGASYGGFMTMSLLTKTNMFRAGISHAGISTLTSYWGEGYWGHDYSAVATANSYPWNRKDIYVENSPIYHADKINTPLLLLHGNIDPNVPKGESWTMYSALKILGKDVELIEVDQQAHWVTDYHKRHKWSRTILAYFDKYLKDQPEWWNELYGDN